MDIGLASIIHDYLPIRKSPSEEEYISLLWNSFLRLTSDDSLETTPFSLTAFHLLFMTAVQYKALRLFREKKDDYERAFLVFHPTRKEERVLLAPSSVFDFRYLKEKTLFQLFAIINVSRECIQNCKGLVDDRNNTFMHASGAVSGDPEMHIAHCLNQLRHIHDCFIPLNDVIAEMWNSDLEEGEEICDFVEKRLFDSQLTPADFQEGDMGRVFGRCFYSDD